MRADLSTHRAERLLARRRVTKFSNFVGFALALLLQLFVSHASAHRLDVDTLSVRIQQVSGEVSGQFLVDPDVARPDGAQTELGGAAKEIEVARLLSFIQEHVVLIAGDESLDLSFQVRELYTKEGAVPGDSVMFSAKLPQGWQTLSVQIREPLERLAVTTSVDGGAETTVLMLGEYPLLLHEMAGTNSPSSDLGLGVVAVDQKGEDRAASGGQSIVARFFSYVWTGILHIIPFGWDHILFVVALTLGSLGMTRRLILELSAFTVAHTITLALGAAKMLTAPSSVVEPLIALSITAVAVEHLVGADNPRLRYGLVGAFGLLHGLGFAGALLDLGFSGGSFVLFLASFNIGVEVGQLAVVFLSLGAFALLARWTKREKATLRAFAMGIAAFGLIVGIARVTDRGESLRGQASPEYAQSKKNPADI